ncbi:hypothetical protein D3C86_1579600 [compost metagenome]
MCHDAVADAELLGRHFPLLRGGCDQHGARRCSRAPKLVPRVRHGRAATGALRRPHAQVVVATGIRWSALHEDLCPRGVQLLGDDGGQARVRALAHFQVLGNHGDGVVGGDTNKGIRLEGPGTGACIGASCPRQVDGERQPGGAMQEAAPAFVFDANGDGHGGVRRSGQ